jgi:phosphoadenosine phosphosulfate reductase
LDNGYKILCYKNISEPQFYSLLKKIIYKATYCKKCGVCIAECPNNAISFYPQFKINTKNCKHCLNCLIFVDNGCLLAKSRYGVIGGNIMNKNKINLDRYSTFGLREEWLVNYFRSPNEWKIGLGSKQIPAFRRWLTEAQLIENNKPSSLFDLIKDQSIEFIWAILWINLCRNSPIAKWYSNLEFKLWERNKLNDHIFSLYPQYAEGTLRNPINALLNTFDNSKYLSDKIKIGLLIKRGRNVQSIDKVGSNEIHPVALLYCLYQYAEKNEYYDFTLSELYREDAELTPYRIFGIEKQALADILRGLQENKYKFVHVEFAANLDNVFLNNEYSAIEVLEIMLGGTAQ